MMLMFDELWQVMYRFGVHLKCSCCGVIHVVDGRALLLTNGSLDEFEVLLP